VITRASVICLGIRKPEWLDGSEGNEPWLLSTKKAATISEADGS
jgi:hypothetical protein